MSKTSRQKTNSILSSRILVVAVIIVASFLAAFLGQMAIDELSRTPSLIPLQNTVIRSTQDSLSIMRRVAQEVVSSERSSTVALYDRVEPQASEARSGLVLTNDGWIVLALAATEATPAVVRLQSGELIDVVQSVQDPYAPLRFVKVASTNLRAANLSTRSEFLLLEPVVLLGIDGDVRLSSMTGHLLTDDQVLRSDELNRFHRLTEGSLGQPAYDAEGEIVGLVVQAEANEDAKMVSASYIRESLNDVLRAQTIVRASLGVSYIDLTAHPIPESLSFGQTSGALITGLVPLTSAGGASGLRTNDIIVAIEGTPLSTRESLSDIIGALEPNQTVSVSVLRRGEPLTIQAVMSSSST
jgi:serine protease Do